MLEYNYDQKELSSALEASLNLTCRQNSLTPNFSLPIDHPLLQSEEDLGTCALPYAQRHLVTCLQLGSNVAFPNSQPFLKRYIKVLSIKTLITLAHHQIHHHKTDLTGD